MKKKQIVIAVGILIGVGCISQIVEKSIDKAGIQRYLEMHVKEQDSYETDYDFKDEKETTFLEWLGF